jgi:hypothetical protein
MYTEQYVKLTGNLVLSVTRFETDVDRTLPTKFIMSVSCLQLNWVSVDNNTEVKHAIYYLNYRFI